MVTATTISEETYLRLALDEPDRKWELHGGRLWEKPSMTFAQNQAAFLLAVDLRNQLAREDYVVGHDAGRLRRAPGGYYLPDVFVVRAVDASPLRGRSDVLEAYPGPALLVVEVWSPSTGDYDAEEKLREYQARGDEETSYLNPYDRTPTAWRRRPDGDYQRTDRTGGTVHLASLPGVVLNIEALFAVL